MQRLRTSSGARVAGALAVSLVLLLLLGGCGEKRRTDPHHERAHDLMLQARTEAGEEGVDYTDPIWLEVIEELSQVHPDFVRHDEDMALLEEIKTMRASAFVARSERKAEEEAEQRRRREEVDRHIDQVLADPFQHGGGSGSGDGDLSEGGRYEVVLQKVGTTTEGNLYVVRGDVLNVSRRTLKNPLVMVDFLDARGRVIRTSQGMIEPLTIPHMGKGRFRVTTPAAGVTSWRLKLRELAGDRLTFKSPDPARTDDEG